MGTEQAVEPVVGPVPGLAGSDGRRKILAESVGLLLCVEESSCYWQDSLQIRG
jgi:hypothetical protein